MDPNDRGVRKFRIALLTMGLVVFGYVLCQPFPRLEPLYSEYCVALIAAAGVFSGSNVLEKYRSARKPDGEAV